MTAVTTDEAAAVLGVTPDGVRQYVKRGHLEWAGKPGVVRLEEAAEVRHRLTPETRKRRLAELAARLIAPV